MGIMVWVWVLISGGGGKGGDIEDDNGKGGDIMRDIDRGAGAKVAMSVRVVAHEVGSGREMMLLVSVVSQLKMEYIIAAS